MTKGLEALEIIVDRLAIKKYDESGNLTYWKSTIDEEYQVIEKELKDVDEIMSNHNCSDLIELNEKLCDYEELKFDDDVKQMKLKALEIVKKKRVHTRMLQMVNDDFTYLDYNKQFAREPSEDLTQEEYDLVKGVFYD